MVFDDRLHRTNLVRTFPNHNPPGSVSVKDKEEERTILANGDVVIKSISRPILEGKK